MLAAHGSLLTAHCPLPTAHGSRLTAHGSLSHYLPQVGCLRAEASLALLRTAGGDHLGVDDPMDADEVGAAEGGADYDAADLTSTHAAGGAAASASVAAGAVLAERLGHLPLALALAAAYMRACDVSCARYLRRLEASSGLELLHPPRA